MDAAPESPHRRREGRLRGLRDAVAARLPETAAQLLAPSRLHQALVGARLTTTPVRFAVREALAPATGPGRTADYRLRGSGLRFVFRHGTVDIGVLSEIFALDVYAPPPAARARLAEDPRPRVVDLGGHIGLFGLWALRTLPGAEVLAYEPDARNHAVLSRAIALNGLGDRWQVRRAAAATAPGELAFDGGLSSGSRVAGPGAAVPGADVVPAEDVLPRLEGAALLKLDIEGSEWPILADPRFAELAPDVVVLEYHPHLCPGDRPRAAAEEVLAGLGYATSEIFHDEPTGVGMLWAVRTGAGAAA